MCVPPFAKPVASGESRLTWGVLVTMFVNKAWGVGVPCAGPVWVVEAIGSTIPKITTNGCYTLSKNGWFILFYFCFTNSSIFEGTKIKKNAHLKASHQSFDIFWLQIAGTAEPNQIEFDLLFFSKWNACLRRTIRLTYYHRLTPCSSPFPELPPGSM